MCVFRGTNRTIVGLLTSAIILASVMTGCAGGASNAAAPLNVTAPIPASGQTPSPPPAPNPPPTPNPPTPNPPSGSQIQWQASLLGQPLQPGEPNISGSVAVDTNGDVAANFAHAAANTNYTVTFCLFPGTLYNDQCLQLTNVTSDAQGSGQLSFHFPQSGTWAGIFRFMNGSQPVFETGGSSADFSSTGMTLRYETQTNPHGTTTATTQDPGGGIVTVTQNNLSFQLKGAVPNATYTIGDCLIGGWGRDCYLEASFTTDANGNASNQFRLGTGNDVTAAVFTIEQNVDASPGGFVTGFKVP